MPSQAPQIVSAFRAAAKELGFEFVAPFELDLPSIRRHLFLGLVSGFGRKRGTIIFELSESALIPQPELNALGYAGSALGESYAVFDRKLFVETLNDWGYFGPAHSKPSWYTGQPWS